MKKAAEVFEKYNLIFLVPVIGIYLFTRLFFAGEIPYYFHINELESAYEAFCVAHFKTDSLSCAPSLYFGNLGKGHSALLIYLGAFLMKLRPGLFSIKLFRLISVTGGLFCLIFTYLFVWLWAEKKKKAFTAALLTAALPLFMISERSCVEDFLFPAILPCAFFFLLYGLKRSKKLPFILSGILFFAALFSCRTAVIIIPVFLAVSLLYLFLIKKIDIISAAALLLPVIAGVLLLCFSKIPGLNAGFENIIPNILNIKALVWNDGHDFYVIPDFGTLYILTVPVFITGAVVLIKKVPALIKTGAFDVSVLILLFFVCTLICSLFLKEPDLSVSCPLLFPAVIIITEGICCIGDNIKGSFPVIIIVFILSLALLSQYYFVNYNSELNHSSDHENGLIADKSVGEALKASIKMYPGKKIRIFTGDFAGRNLLIALYGGASPSDYRAFCKSDSFSFGDIKVNPSDGSGIEDDCVYIIDQYGYPELSDQLMSLGFGATFLKEYTVFCKN